MKAWPKPDAPELDRGRQQTRRNHGACDMISQINPKPTSRNSEFYLVRMKACEAEAGTASLPNVRDRALRAAAAWQEMHEKAQLFEKRQGR